ncbi:hypothetical protein Pfo_012165 [Paulownia fortunei]|nr:hypothetical protein Pfo_012165 [Paulownia fortunei]
MPTLLSISHAKSDRSGTCGYCVEGLDCLSWRLAVEANNLQGWKLVPESCYNHDCELVADAAIEYAQRVKLAGDGKDVWVFDIDETTLSNIPYYNRSDFYKWVAEGAAPPVSAVLRLYNKVLSLGFKTVILTASSDMFKEIRTTNLNNVGYYNWEKLIFKGEADRGISGAVFKSKKRTELVNEGYRIVGYIGDQWTDLLGADVGNRTFKVPNPMYYIG